MTCFENHKNIIKRRREIEWVWDNHSDCVEMKVSILIKKMLQFVCEKLTLTFLPPFFFIYLCQVLGTPSEDSWPGVNTLPHFKPGEAFFLLSLLFQFSSLCLRTLPKLFSYECEAFIKS